MKGCDGVRLVPVHLAQGRKLVAQDIEDQARIHFRVIHMAALKAAVMIMLDQVVIGITRECQGVEPERIDRGVEQPGQRRPGGHEMREVMAQDIVTQHMPGLGK